MTDAAKIHRTTGMPPVGLRSRIRRLALGTAFFVVLGASALLIAHSVRLSRQAEDRFVLTSSRWLADALVSRGNAEQAQILAAVTQRTGVHCAAWPGLLPETLRSLSPEDVRRIENDSPVRRVLNGQTYVLAVTSFRPPFSNRSVLVALPVSPFSGIARMDRSVFLFAVPGILLCVLSVLFIFARHSGQLMASLNAVHGQLERAQYSRNPEALFVALQTPMNAGPEWRGTIEAISRLEQRIAAEYILYADARDEVEQLDGRRTDLLTDVSMDLYVPLEKIVVLTERLLSSQDGELSQSQREDVEIVQKSSRRLRSMVEEIVDLSSLMTDSIPFDDAPVDLREIADDVVSEARGRVGTRHLEIRVECDEGVGFTVSGSRQRLWQVVSNLVGNSLRFTESGSIVIGLAHSGDNRVAVTVKDTGCGISRSDLKNVFSAFEQSGSRAARKGGTGLGLAICQQLVRLHGGEISLDSEFGTGTLVTVRLPAVRS